MRKLWLLVLLVLVGCSDTSKEIHFPAMPPELADCKVFYVSNSSWEHMTVVRCPLSVTTTEVTARRRNGPQ